MSLLRLGKGQELRLLLVWFLQESILGGESLTLEPIV